MYQLLGASKFLLCPLSDLVFLRDRVRPRGPRAVGRRGHLLALAPGLVMTRERNVATLARLERCGIESITGPGNELCGSRRTAQPVLPGQPGAGGT